MSNISKNTTQANLAAIAIIGDRDPKKDIVDILITMEQSVTAILLMATGDPRMAAMMLNDALVPAVEGHLSFFASKLGGKQ
ncbi:GntR family transcriptional regulator [Agrobacterium vitis]